MLLLPLNVCRDMLAAVLALGLTPGCRSVAKDLDSHKHRFAMPAPAPQKTPLTLTLTQPTQATRPLSTRWLWCWIVVRLLVDGVLRLIGSFTVPDLASAVVLLVAATFLITVAVGLIKRQLWAWRANFVVIFADALLQPAGNPLRHSPYLFDVGLWCLLWTWPNSVYFRKSRSLFETPTPG